MALALQAGVNCHGVLWADGVTARALSRDLQLRRHRRARRERDVLETGAATAIACDGVNRKRQGVRAGRLDSAAGGTAGPTSGYVWAPHAADGNERPVPADPALPPLPRGLRA